MLPLRRCRRNVAFVCKSFLCGGGARCNTAATAIKADVGSTLNHGFPVNIVDDIDVHIVYAGVVEKLVARPIAPGVAITDVAVPIVNSAIKSDFRTPVPIVP
jgi:hypothetical protein